MFMEMREREKFAEGREYGREEGREVGITGSVELLKELGLENETIIQKIMSKYNLTKEKAESFLYSSVKQ